MMSLILLGQACYRIWEDRHKEAEFKFNELTARLNVLAQSGRDLERKIQELRVCQIPTNTIPLC